MPSVAWTDASKGQGLDGPVRAGRDSDGSLFFAGRALHEGDVLPARVLPENAGAFVSYGGCAYFKEQYEVMGVSDAVVAWVATQGDKIPPLAVAVGQTSDGEALYMGRVLHEGALIPGNVHPSHAVCYIAHNEKEMAFPEYEILVLM